MFGLATRRTAVVVAAVVAIVGAGFSTMSAGAAVHTASVLGTKDPAKGTPVKIGVVSNGTTSTLGTSPEPEVSQATVKGLNDYQGGIAGHPIEREVCTDNNDPGKALDCANQMIADKVAAVAIGSDGLSSTIWGALHDAGIPVFLYGAPDPKITADATSTFVMGNSRSALLGLPVAVAKKEKAKTVSVVVIDVPAATAFYTSPTGAQMFKDAGIGLDMIPVAAGTADMTPQMQKLTSSNPKGVVFVLGNDSFCIAAFNGLRTAGFKGTITTLPACVSDATRTAVPADFLKGMKISASSPLGDPKDVSMKQFAAVMKKYGASDVNLDESGPAAMFEVLGAMNVATKDLKGEVTPQSVIAATKGMPWSVLPGTGGLHFRCNGKADPDQPAVCSSSTLAATLDAQGKATTYTPVADTEIPA